MPKEPLPHIERAHIPWEKKTRVVRYFFSNGMVIDMEQPEPMDSQDALSAAQELDPDNKKLKVLGNVDRGPND